MAKIVDSTVLNPAGQIQVVDSAPAIADVPVITAPDITTRLTAQQLPSGVVNSLDVVEDGSFILTKPAGTASVFQDVPYNYYFAPAFLAYVTFIDPISGFTRRSLCNYTEFGTTGAAIFAYNAANVLVGGSPALRFTIACPDGTFTSTIVTRTFVWYLLDKPASV